MEKVVHFLFPVVFFRSALEWFPIQLMKLTFASLLFHSCKEFMLLDQICLWVKNTDLGFSGTNYSPVKDTASSAYFVCIIQVKRNPHRNNEKGVLQLTMSMCDHHTWDLLFAKRKRLSGSRPYVFHRSATTQEVGFLQKAKKEGGLI